MMIRKTLTFLLAAILTLESPLTVYAAQTEESAGRTIAQAETLEKGHEIPEGNDASIEEETSEEKSGRAENPGTGDEIPEEPDNLGTGEGTPGEPDNPGTGEETPVESENPETGEETAGEPENPDSEEDSSGEQGKPDTEGELPEEPVDNTPEEDVLPEDGDEQERPDEIEITVSGNSVSENVLSAAAFSARVSEVMTLSFEKAANGGVEITLPPNADGTETYVWYSFTAPDAGTYVFYTQERFSDFVEFCVCAEPDKKTMLKNWSSENGDSLYVVTEYMEKGETVYLGSYTGRKDSSLTYNLRAVYQTLFTKNSDGSYTTALPDGDSVTVRARAGRSRFQIEVTGAAKKPYWLTPYYCPADHSEGYSVVYQFIYTDDKGSKVSSDILPAGTYHTACKFTRGTLENRFVKFAASMEPFKIEGADSRDIVYVHDAVCEENSITLDLESLVRDRSKLICRYQPVDGSEKPKEKTLVGWDTYVFDGLKAGTAYRFEIRDLETNMLLKMLNYTTKESGIVIEDARAEISKDFSKLTVHTKPVCNGTEEQVKLFVRMTDSLQRECSFEAETALSDRDAQGYLTVEFDAAGEGVFLKPGVTYPMQVTMTYLNGAAATAPKSINVEAPPLAYISNAADVDFSITQNAGERLHADYDVTVRGLAEAVSGCIFFKPATENRVPYSWHSFRLEKGETENSPFIVLPETSLGSDYEFTLSIGGVTKTKTLKIENQLGVHLERVETAADEVGPFHFVRTYRLAGNETLTDSYYLQLQAFSLLPDGDWGYGDVGKPVELNRENGYQATVSTAAVGWAPDADIDYRLRWIAGKSENVDSKGKDLLAVAYESLKTGKPHIRLEKVGGSHTSQSYQVTLGAEDTAALKEHGVEVTLCRYIREKGAQTESKNNKDYVLKPTDNYSATESWRWLKEDTEYEISLRDKSGEKIYATDVFRTGKDNRSLSVTQTKVYVDRVEVYYALSGFDAYTDDYVVCWYRQAGNSRAWKQINAYSANKDGNFVLSGLEENMSYEYVLGIGKRHDEVPYLTHTVKETVTTLTDTRRIETSVKARTTSAEIICRMFDMDVTVSSIAAFLMREKGQEKWETIAEERYSANEEIKTLSLDRLKENTVYEYRVGFAKDWHPDPADLEHAAEGEFRTAADLRDVGITAEPKAYSAKIHYTLSNMEGADDGYLLGYFRMASEAEETAWEKVHLIETSDKAVEDTFVIGDLEEETSYELTMGFGDTDAVERDSLKHPKTINFTTGVDGRRLSEATARVEDENVTLMVKFSGNVERRDSFVQFFYRVENGTDYKKAGRVVNVSSVEEDIAAVTLSGLLKETKYEFAAVLTNDGKCDRPEAVARDAYRTFGSFTTPEAVKPIELTVSQKQLYLNANALYAKERGYGYENLKVQWKPFEANADLKWKSSDEAVATVTEDGKVCAVAPGKATITATSVYAEEISASCEVTVGDYQIGRKSADGSISLAEEAKLLAVRDNSYEGYVLCRTVDGNPVEAACLEPVSGNESIAQWRDGVIETKRAGDTRLVFTSEADQVQAFLAVSVQPSTGRGFAITGFSANRAAYPALKEDARDEAGRDQYMMVCTQNIIYTAVGEIMPSRPGFDSGDFNWSIDKTDVATVDEKGKIKPLKAGDALLRVEPKNADNTVRYKTQICEVALHFKELPSHGSSMLWALEKTHKKLGDVKLPEDWDGWRWKYPDTPILINGENKESYSFVTVYEGEQYYPDEISIDVKIGRITGLSAYEAGEGNHNHVLEVGSADGEGNPAADSDSLTLCVESLFDGDMNYEESLNYTYRIEMSAPAGIVLKEGEYTKPVSGRIQKVFTVTAMKKGNYTLTPVIKVTDPKTKHEKVMAKASFKIQAVEEKQAYIALEPEQLTGITSEQGRIVANFGGSVKSFQVCAKLLDRNDKESDTFERVKLAWSSSDNKVVTVKASKDTHSADVKIVGDGHAILTAKVKDKAGRTATAQIEIRSRAPRVDVSRVTVNPAYDFDSAEGRRLAFENGGAVEVVPAYGTVRFGTVRLWKSDKKTLETDLKLVEYEEGGKYCYLICAADSVEEKVYDCYLGVESPVLLSESFFHPLKVTVKTKQPKVTVKSVRPANLFYRTDPASVDIGIAQKGIVIESVRWLDSAEGEKNGFSSEPSEYKFDTAKKGKNVERMYFAQEDIGLTDGKKPEEPGIVSGTVEIRCKGYREIYKSAVTLKWNYKKPAIAVKEKEATLIPSLEGHVKGSFLLYNGEKRLLFKNGSAGTDDPRVCYHELTFHNKELIKSGFRDYTYVGNKTKGSEKLTMTIVSDFWREPLSAVHKIKLANPTPYLAKSKLVMNTRYVDTAYTDIELKNAYTSAISCDDIVIEGKNAKSQALLDEDILEMEQNGAGSNRIVVRLNRAQTMGQEAIKNGTYDFRITPCFRDVSGQRIVGKTLTLKIQATNKAVTAKVKLSGSLDLSKNPKKVDGTDTVKNYVDVRTTLQNIGDNYSYNNKSGLSLVGEYSKYFSVSYFDSVPGLYRIRINKNNESKLKAGQRYRLAIRCTLKLENGETVQVLSPMFTIRPKQSVPKVTVQGNSQTLFAANDKLTRTCGFELPEGMGYRIKGLSGSIDCNRDGKEDITVSWVQKDSTEHYAAAELKLTDRDGALTVSGMKGKTYKIPVIITLQGRDGIAKDVKTSIKVTVRR
ncbi:MAG: Ig-like domain-containing protein [Lachnospiraceae bacterium]|nr:Ig-like domain-containing protein [Lachnospiraceae bacterium]